MAVLPDILDRRTVTVLCGSAAGTASARLGRYRAGRGNRFRKTLFETGLTGRLRDPAGFARVAEYGLDPTDLARCGHGPDSALSPDACDAREQWRKIEAVRPRLLAFSGKAPARRWSSIGPWRRLAELHRGGAAA